jgi:hypothetical protein
MDSRKGLEKWFGRMELARSGQTFEHQPFELLRAFESINDPVLREEIIILVELVAQHPSVVRRTLSAAASVSH